MKALCRLRVEVYIQCANLENTLVKSTKGKKGKKMPEVYKKLQNLITLSVKVYLNLTSTRFLLSF